MKIVQPDTAGIEEAVAALRRGEVVAYPTETVYGLAVDPFSEAAIRRLFEVKGREESNPILVVISERSQLEQVALEISARSQAFMDAFWPGPLSLLLPRAAGIPLLLTAGGEKVCVRHTLHPVAQQLCARFGGPVTSSSANRSGCAPASSLESLELPGVTIGIDGGVLPASSPSTVFDPDENIVLREGRISRALLLQVAGSLG